MMEKAFPDYQPEVALHYKQMAAMMNIHDSEERSDMKKTLQALAGSVFILLMFFGALWLLHNELRQYHLSDFLNAVAQIPAKTFWLAAGLTMFNFVILIGYDWLAIRYIRHPMKLGRIGTCQIRRTA